MKLRAFTDKRVGRYLLYALGEIILVVAGILIALEINNKNEENKLGKLRNNILKTVSSDLAADTLMLRQAIAYYEIRDTLSASLVKGNYSKNGLKKCLYCPSLNISYFPVILNEKGHLQLKNFNQDAMKGDTLVTQIVQFYTQADGIISGFGQKVEANSIQNIQDWKNQHAWFADLLFANITDEFLEYMATSQDFRNRTAYFNTIACKNYLLALRQYKIAAKELITQIETEIAED